MTLRTIKPVACIFVACLGVLLDSCASSAPVDSAADLQAREELSAIQRAAAEYSPELLRAISDCRGKAGALVENAKLLMAAETDSKFDHETRLALAALATSLVEAIGAFTAPADIKCQPLESRLLEVNEKLGPFLASVPTMESNQSIADGVDALLTRLRLTSKLLADAEDERKGISDKFAITFLQLDSDAKHEAVRLGYEYPGNTPAQRELATNADRKLEAFALTGERAYIFMDAILEATGRPHGMKLCDQSP